MATIAQDNQDQNQNQPNQPKPTAGTSSPTGSGTGVGVGSQQVSQVQQNQAPQANNGYTDVGSYLNANQNQQGGNQIGSQIASNLNTGYQNTQNAINNSVNTANNAVNSGYTPENTQLIQQVAANPTSAAASPDQLSQFQGQLNDTYGGPTSWADYGTQQGNVATAQQNASLVNTPGGNNALVQQVENQLNPGQSGQGVNALDTLLFQGNPNAVNTAQTAANQYNNLNDYLNQANTGVNNNIASAQNNAAQTSQDALNAFTGANGTLTNLNTNINNTAASDLTAAQAQQAQIQQDLSNLYGGVAQNNAPTTLGTYGGGTTPWGNTTNYTVGNLPPQDLQALGMTQDQWNQLQGSLQQAGTSTMANGHNFAAPSETSQIDLSQYLNQSNPATAINAGTVATPQQYQEVAAINQLLGSQAPTQTEAINPLNASQAGTYNPNNLNQFNYNAALSNAQNTAQQEQAAAQQEAAALTGQADLAHAQSQHGGFLNSNIGGILGSAINPASWIPNAINAVENKPISGTNIGSNTNLKGNYAQGGEVMSEPGVQDATVGDFGPVLMALISGGTSAAPEIAEPELSEEGIKDLSQFQNKDLRELWGKAAGEQSGTSPSAQAAYTRPDTFAKTDMFAQGGDVSEYLNKRKK